jgi:ABC-2 type transport system permease protein
VSSLHSKKNKLHYSWILINEVTRTDFKLRYNDSLLGYLWSVLKPLALFSILYVVFAKIFRVGDAIPYYSVYLLTGVVFWSFFQEITFGGVTAIVEKGDLLRKINFPKYTIVISKAISASINLCINFLVIIAFMILFGADPSWWAVLVVPLLLIELFILGIATSFILSTAFVRFRDISYIWEVVLQALFYATPLLYPISFVVDNFSPKIANLMMLNPIAQIVQDVRYVLVTQDTLTFEQLFGNSYVRLVPILITIVLFIIGFLYFKSRQASFSEEV